MRDLVLALRVHGSRSDYHHDHIGINSRLDAIQATVLHVKLRFLNQWNQQRRENAGRYTQLFEEAGLLDRVTPPWIDPANLHVFNQYTIRAHKRDQLMAHLRARIVYWLRMPARRLGRLDMVSKPGLLATRVASVFSQQKTLEELATEDS